MSDSDELEQIKTMSEPLDKDGFTYEDLYLLARADIERLKRWNDENADLCQQNILQCEAMAEALAFYATVEEWREHWFKIPLATWRNEDLPKEFRGYETAQKALAAYKKFKEGGG